MKKLLTVILMSAMLCGVAEVEAQSYHKKGFGFGIEGAIGCLETADEGYQKLDNTHRELYYNAFVTVGYHFNENFYAGLMTNAFTPLYLVARYDMSRFEVNPYVQAGVGSIVSSFAHKGSWSYRATASAGVSWRRFTLGLMFDYGVGRSRVVGYPTDYTVERDNVYAVTLGYFF